MKEILDAILSECDDDIKEIMLKEQTVGGDTYQQWSLLRDPANTILLWQAMRDRNRGRVNSNVGYVTTGYSQPLGGITHYNGGGGGGTGDGLTVTGDNIANILNNVATRIDNGQII